MAAPRSAITELEDQFEHAARSIWSGAQAVLWTLFLVGWSALCGLMALLGWLFSWPTLIAGAGGVFAVTWVIFLAVRARRRSSLERRAKVELLARAQRDRLRIDPQLRDALRAFDVSYARIGELLARSELVDERLAVDAGVDLEKTREHLYQIARTKVRAAADLRRFGRTRVATDAVDRLQAEILDRQREAEQIAQEVIRLSTRLEEIHALASARSEAAPGSELEKVFAELDRTSAAYREIAAAEDDVARRIREARALRQRS